MVIPFPARRGQPGLSRDASLDEMLRRLHEADEGEDLQRAVDRLARLEQDAVASELAGLCAGRPQDLCRLLF